MMNIGKQADELREDIELLEGASTPFNSEHYLKGLQTPVFFGSEQYFYISEMLDAFVEVAPAPRQRSTNSRGFSYEEAFRGGFLRFKQTWIQLIGTESPS